MNILITEFLTHCEFEKNLNPKTLKAYKIDLTQFSAFIKRHIESNINIGDISKEEIKSYLIYLNKKYAIKSVKRKLATTKAFFNYLEFEDKIQVNPFRKVRVRLKEPFRLPTVLDISEIRMLFRIVYKKKNSLRNKHSFKYKTILRDIAILELLFGTGMRVSELCNLKSDHVNLEERTGFVKIRGKGNKDRIIQLCNPELLQSLHAYRETGVDSSCIYFFKNRIEQRLSPQSVRFMIRKYVSETNIKKNITPHCFRHTFATLLLEEGVDIKYIQKILGHSSILTTQIYTHVTNQKQRQILELQHPRNRLSF
ncbi:MAG: tyrosine-type recombinase/integrase [Balneolales bacterium]|nr:tyrosine-type recombinase/integrase [Balneolales bacterium]